MDNCIRNSAISWYSDAIKSSRDLACRVKTRTGCSGGGGGKNGTNCIVLHMAQTLKVGNINLPN